MAASRRRIWLLAGFSIVLAGCGLNTAGEGPVDGGDVPVEGLDGDVTVSDDGPVREDVTVTDDGAGDLGDDGGAEADDGGDGGPDCGNGILDPGEECDDGTANSDTAPGACRTDCRRFWCGDCVVDPGEGCDPCLTTECSDECVPLGCGNGTVDPGEACDDGNADNTDDCLDTCAAASCGDGFVWAGHELCDLDPPAACDTVCGSSGTRACVDCVWEAGCTPPAETCNGVDDDCDAVADDGFDCARGTTVGCTTTCGTSGMGICTTSCAVPAAADCTPPSDVCNGIDDDCDTVTDEDSACTPGETRTCATACAGVSGVETCTVGCEWGPCTPPAETCNGADDDCDTVADDGFDCAAGATVPCPTTCGSTGSGTCSATCTLPAAADCTVPVETCNSVDDDCDGATDEDFTCVRGATRSCTSACGSTGVQPCDDTCTWAACVPPPEACNGVDDDCNGVTDETFDCVRGTSRGCTTACGGAGGEQLCSSTCVWGLCVPPAEACNAADDDCDGETDEDFACVRGATRPCTTACGTTGVEACSAACAWGSCIPPAEACNGVDDDCNGATDEAFDCLRGTSVSCTTSCGTTGTGTCTDACALPTGAACAAPAETCNGADDDCDTVADDGFDCARGATRTCTTPCGSTGGQSCSASCTWSACAAPAETCNALDDDCDGETDETFACIRGATVRCTTSCGTTGSGTCSATCTVPTAAACTPPAEACNGADDDCDGATDEGLAGCNDTCATAIDITSIGTIAGDTTPATHDNPNCASSGTCSGSTARDVWYRFTLTRREVVFLSL